jgi:hypothetical protein
MVDDRDDRVSAINGVRALAVLLFGLVALLGDAASANAGPASAFVKIGPPPPRLTFGGLTSQGLPITIITEGSLVLEVEYTLRYSCPRVVHLSKRIRWNRLYGPEQLTSQNFGTVRIGKGGGFLARLEGYRLNRFDIGGRVRGERIHGILEASGRTDALVSKASYPRVTCRTGFVRYAATRSN